MDYYIYWYCTQHATDITSDFRSQPVTVTMLMTKSGISLCDCYYENYQDGKSQTSYSWDGTQLQTPAFFLWLSTLCPLGAYWHSTCYSKQLPKHTHTTLPSSYNINLMGKKVRWKFRSHPKKPTQWRETCPRHSPLRGFWNTNMANNQEISWDYLVFEQIP